MEFKLNVCTIVSSIGHGGGTCARQEVPPTFMWSHLLLLIFIQLIKFHLRSKLWGLIMQLASSQQWKTE